MAHVGNPYPVLFRRDWNLNVQSNRFGYANRYILKMIMVGGGPVSGIANKTYDLGPAHENPAGRMTWNSGPINFGPFVFHIELYSEFTPNGSAYVRRWELFEDHYGYIAGVRIAVDGTPEPGFDTNTPGQTIFWDPNWFSSYPFLELSSIRPKFWVDGPPH